MFVTDYDNHFHYSEIWKMTDYMKEVKEKNRQKKESIDQYLGIKRRKTEDGTMLIEMPVRFIK